MVGVSAVRQFFVVGSGRSGTTWMSQFLGSHPEVHALGWEARFLVDPGGLEDLTRALTDAYTPYYADDAMRRLSWLLGERVAGRSMEAFRGWGLIEEIGAENYWPVIDQLWRELTWYEFDEQVLPGGLMSGQTAYMPHERVTHRRVVGRYFQDRGELLDVLRRCVSGLFEPAARRAGKSSWVEKTPLGLLSASFLWELFPNARIVHMLRDPIAVVASHRDQGWAPTMTEQAINWVEPIYRRWLSERSSLRSDVRYVELKLEDLAADWPQRRLEVLQSLDLADADDMLGIDASSVHHRADQLAEADRELVLNRLGDVRQALGYD